MPHSPGFRNRRGDPKRSGEPARIGAILEELLVRDPALAGGMTVGRLAAMWSDVVGPRLASETAPVALERGTLTVAATTGPWGAQARFLADEIRKKANEALGAELVAKVHVVVRPGPPDALRPNGS